MEPTEKDSKKNCSGSKKNCKKQKMKGSKFLNLIKQKKEQRFHRMIMRLAHFDTFDPPE